MLGLFFQIIISHFIIRWIQNENLSVLGLRPSKTRVNNLLLFCLIAGVCSFITFFLRILFAKELWILNPSLNWQLAFNAIWYNIKSVMFEELIFRGVLLYILIKRVGSRNAILISSISFGIYHWFTYEVLNDPNQMFWIFVITFSAGYIYALGYFKTNSLYAPIGMHFGWNIVQSFIFSAGNIGSGLFVQKLPVPQIQISYPIYYLITFLHLFLFVLIFALIFRKGSKKPIEEKGL